MTAGLTVRRRLAGPARAWRRPLTARRLRHAFAALDGVRGRPLAEIVERTAAPDSVLGLPDGQRVCHWQSAPGWGAVYAITLLFDATDRCLAVQSENGYARLGHQGSPRSIAVA